MTPFIIIGLGNPGREYEQTRHNIGFLLVNEIGKSWNISIKKFRYKAMFGEGIYMDKKILLIKPQTYMNNSGYAVRNFMRFYKADPGNILVIHDDIDLPFGEIRIRKKGGSAGQKGVNSIITHLQTEEFPRLRLGIGRPPGRIEPRDYVLKKFSGEQMNDLDYFLGIAIRSVETILTDGIDAAMTAFNHSVLDDE